MASLPPGPLGPRSRPGDQGGPGVPVVPPGKVVQHVVRHEEVKQCKRLLGAAKAKAAAKDEAKEERQKQQQESKRDSSSQKSGCGSGKEVEKGTKRSPPPYR